MNTSSKKRPPSGGRCFQFAYLIPPSGGGDRNEMPYKTRDPEASKWLESVLQARGYQYSGPILNYAGKPLEPGPEPDLDALRLGPQDILVLTTRPPLNDHNEGNRKKIDRSHTKLETLILSRVQSHLSHCSRTKVDVAFRHQRANAEIRRLGIVEFAQHGGGDLQATLDQDTNRWVKTAPPKSEPASNSTLAYLIYERELWENGPALLVSFGMCGTDTLAWNYWLATRHPKLIARVPFLMGEITNVTRPAKPTTLAFADDWKIRIHRPATARARTPEHAAVPVM